MISWYGFVHYYNSLSDFSLAKTVYRGLKFRSDIELYLNFRHFKWRFLTVFMFQIYSLFVRCNTYLHMRIVLHRCVETSRLFFVAIYYLWYISWLQTVFDGAIPGWQFAHSQTQRSKQHRHFGKNKNIKGVLLLLSS